jgi:hypothetical protein
MKNLLRNLSVAFAAGCAGGIVGAVLLWTVAETLLKQQTGYDLTVKVSTGWVAHFTLLGGLWGFLQLLPIFKNALWKRGLVLSVIPIVAMLTEFALLPKTEGYFFPMVIAKTKPWTEIGALLVWGQISTFWFAKAK